MVVSGRTSHRQRLIDGALRCVSEKGYAATTARDIAAAADANLGSIGYHFGSKEALLQEAIGEGFCRWTAHVAERMLGGETSSPEHRLRVSLQAMQDTFDEHRGLLLAFIEALPPAARSPELRAQLGEQYQDSQRAFAALIRLSLGDETPVDIESLAWVLIALADGLVIQWLLRPKGSPDADTVTDVIQSVMTAQLRS